MTTLVYILWMLTSACPAVVAVFADEAQCESTIAHLQRHMPDPSMLLWCETVKYHAGRPV